MKYTPPGGLLGVAAALAREPVVGAAAALIARRAHLLAVLAGVAWLLGMTPSVSVRLLTVGLLVAGGVLDAVSDAGGRTAAIRITTLRGRRP